jgi:CheY-like chemotaxis protein
MKRLGPKREFSNLIDQYRHISAGADVQQLLKAGPDKGGSPRPDSEAKSADRMGLPAPIYLVDDEPRLTELYSIVLEAAGYVAKPFNDRIEALTALKTETPKPGLLIMDYLGHPMPTERFIERCRILHPRLRVLLASGFNELDRRLASVRAEGFIQKPFTADAFLREVRATMTK